MRPIGNQRRIEEKSLFGTFCIGVGAVAAAPKAGQAIRQIADFVRDKTGGERKWVWEVLWIKSSLRVLLFFCCLC